MATVAEQLRQARQAQNLTIQQLAEITKIRADHIAALEEGNYKVFAAPVYIRGFVRSCAAVLKLDIPNLLCTLDAELAQTEEFREPPPLTETRRGPIDDFLFWLSRIKWRKAGWVLAVLAIIALIVLAVAAWRRDQTADPLRDLKPALYQPPPDSGGDTLPVPPPTPRR